MPLKPGKKRARGKPKFHLWEKFVRDYKPVINTIRADYDKKNPNDGVMNGHMFETYGPEYEFVMGQKKRDNHHVFTVLSCEGNCFWIVPGWHWVNRMGYLVTENPWKDEDIELSFRY